MMKVYGSKSDLCRRMQNPSAIEMVSKRENSKFNKDHPLNVRQKEAITIVNIKAMLNIRCRFFLRGVSDIDTVVILSFI